MRMGGEIILKAVLLVVVYPTGSRRGYMPEVAHAGRQVALVLLCSPSILKCTR